MPESPSAPSVSGNGAGVESVARSQDLRKYTRCNFCGKGQDEVQHMVAGPGVYICSACIGLCEEVLREHNLATKPRRRPRLSAEDRRLVQNVHGALVSLCVVWTDLRERLEVQVPNP